MACSCGNCCDGAINCTVSTEICDALNAANTPSGTNPVATIDDITASGNHPAVTSICTTISVDPTTQVLSCSFNDWLCEQTGLVDAVAAPADPTCPTIHINTATNCFQLWNTTSLAWTTTFCSGAGVVWDTTGTVDPNGDGITPGDVTQGEILYNANSSWQWDVDLATWVEVTSCPCPLTTVGPFIVNGQAQECGTMTIYDTSAGGVIEQLPDAVARGNGCKICYKMVGGAGVNPLVLQPTGGQSIDGVLGGMEPANTLWNEYETRCIVSDGSDWKIVGEYDPNATCPCPVPTDGVFTVSTAPVCGEFHQYAPVGADLDVFLPIAAVGVSDGCKIGYQNLSNDYRVTINASGIDTIDGLASHIIDTQYETVWLIADAANNEWHIINNFVPNLATGFRASSIGSNNVASGDYSRAEGVNNGSADEHAYSFGSGNFATVPFSIAFGYANFALGQHSFARGANNTVSGIYGSGIGYGHTVSGDYAQTLGRDNQVTGDYSHAVNRLNTASGVASFAEGYDTEASGDYSHAQGYQTIAGGDRSFAHGYGSEAASNDSIVMGAEAYTIHPTSPGAMVINLTDNPGTVVSLTASAAEQFNVGANGGFRFFTNDARTTGMTMASGGSAWAAVSKRELKRNFENIPFADWIKYLRLANLQTWEFPDEVKQTTEVKTAKQKVVIDGVRTEKDVEVTTEVPTEENVRHVWMMAEDFEPFGLGDKPGETVNATDLAGLALVFVQRIMAGMDLLMQSSDPAVVAFAKSLGGQPIKEGK